MEKNQDFNEMKKQLFEKINNKMFIAKHLNMGLKNPLERFFEEENFIVTYDGMLYYYKSYTNGDFLFPELHRLSHDQINMLISLMKIGLKRNETKYDCCDGDTWDLRLYNKSGFQVAKFEGYIYGVDRLEKICKYLIVLTNNKNMFDRYLVDNKIHHRNFTTFFATDKLTGENVCLHQQSKNAQGNNIGDTFNILKKLSEQSSLFASTYDTYEDIQNKYFVTECVQGTSLHQILCHQKLPLETAIEIAKDTAIALEIVHSFGFLLLNITPLNMIINKKGDVKLLIDIGSKINNEYTCFPKDILCRPGYTPPEIYAKKVLGTYTDVYMLAATLYALITGEQPTDSLYRYKGMPLKSISEHVSAVPPKLEHIIFAAMNLSISERTQTARELYDQLNSI